MGSVVHNIQETGSASSGGEGSQTWTKFRFRLSGPHTVAFLGRGITVLRADRLSLAARDVRAFLSGAGLGGRLRDEEGALGALDRDDVTRWLHHERRAGALFTRERTIHRERQRLGLRPSVPHLPGAMLRALGALPLGPREVLRHAAEVAGQWWGGRG